MSVLSELIIEKRGEDEVAEIVGDEEFLHSSKKIGRVFVLQDQQKQLNSKVDDLIEVEIALRKCRRLGVFDVA